MATALPLAPALPRLAAMLALCALAACGDRDGDAPVPLAASGPSEVKVEGVAYLADLQPSDKGATLTVTRPAPPMAYDEGALAKQVAVQFCAGRGKRLAPWALGKFMGQAWVFEGGCA